VLSNTFKVWCGLEDGKAWLKAIAHAASPTPKAKTFTSKRKKTKTSKKEDLRISNPQYAAYKELLGSY
jgi:hypothetical protein